MKKIKIKITQKGMIRFTKKSLLSIFTAWLIIVGSGLLYLFGPWSQEKVEAAWMDDNWAYRKAISFTHNANVSNTYIQLDAVDTTAAPESFQSDCGDVRFTDINGNLLRYYYDSGAGACDTASTDFNVLIPSIVSGTNTLYMYYGNPSATNGTEAANFTESETTPSGGAASAGSEEKGPSPVGYWRFDEGTDNTCSGGTNDQCNSGNGGTTIDGVQAGTIAWKTEDLCVSGKCLYFDGSDDRINLTNSTLLKPTNGMTVSAWIKVTGGAGTSREIFTRWDTTGGVNERAYYFDVNSSNQVAFGISSNGTDAATVTVNDSTTVTNGVWYFYAGTWDGSTMKLYRNGVEVDSDSQSAISSSANTRTGIGAALGRAGDPTISYFYGFIDEPKFYNYARTAAQIKADFNAKGNNEGSGAQLGVNQNNQYRALSDGLQAYWKFDESSWTGDCSTGSVTDYSGNARSARVCPNGSAPTPNTGRFGNGLLLNGSSQYAAYTTTNIGQATPTYSVWVNVTSTPSSGNNMSIISVGDSTADCNISLSNNYSSGPAMTGFGFVCYSTDVTNIHDSVGSLPSTGRWYHLALTRDANTVRFYVDGVLVKEAATSGKATYTGSGQVGMGLRLGSTQYFNGTIDEVRIYSKALQGGEISQLTNFSPGPVGYWKLDEKTGTSTYDSSSNANTGTITGATWTTQGKVGSALSFDGDDNVDAGSGSSISFTTGNEFSVAFWFKTTSSNGYMVSKYKTTSTGGYVVYLSSGQINIYAETTSSSNWANENTIATYNDGNWHHVVGTWERNSSGNITSTIINIYVDGVIVTSSGKSGAGTVNNVTCAATCNLKFGSSSNDASYYTGLLDDIKIFNYTLEERHVTSVMNADHPAPAANAVGYWKFDEGALNTCSGGSNDACNYGNGGTGLDATLNGDAAYTNSGKFGKALTLDGSGDYVSVGNPAGVQNIFSTSITAWIKTSSATQQGILTKYNSNNNAGVPYFFDIESNGKLRYYLDGDANCSTTTGDAYRDGNTAINDGNWHHVAGVYDAVNQTLRVYVDGRDDSGTLTNTVPSALPNCTDQVEIGSFQSNGSGTRVLYFTGQIDEVKLYHAPITLDQIKMDMNRGGTQVLGALGNNSSYQPNAANQQYCVPGDSTSCASPVGEWHFNEKTGSTARDTSGNSNTGTISGATFTQGKLGAALNFDGNDDGVYFTRSSQTSTGLNVGSSNFTMSAWIKTTSTSAATRIIYDAYGGTQFHRIYLNTSHQATMQVRDAESDSATATGTTALNNGKWHHVVGVRSGTTIYIYVDGVAENSATNASLGSVDGGCISEKVGATDTQTGFCSANNVTESEFTGQIDLPRKYAYARSAAQIAWDYNRGAPVGWWKFDECQGTTAYDYSLNGNEVSNGNNGTITPGAAGSQTSVGNCSTNASTMWYGGNSGKYGSSLHFDGDDYVIKSSPTGLPTGTSARTMAGWFKLDSSSIAGYSMFQQGNNSVDGQRFGLFVASTCGGSLGVETRNASLIYTWSVPDTNWHHLTAVFPEGATNVNQTIIYLDGKQMTTVCNASSQTINTAADELTIGILPSAHIFGFVGLLDDLRIYNYALTATQVKTLMNQGSATRFGPTQGQP